MTNLEIIIVDGKWTINGYQIHECTYYEKQIFDAFIKASLTNAPIPEVTRAEKQPVKESFFKDYPNISKLIFEPA